MQRIHIVGSGPRTGTTLMAELMIACFEIDAHTQHETRIFCLPPSDANIYLTKAPQDILVIGPLLRIMTNLHVIYMLRDPRDTIVSEHGRSPNRFYSGLRFWKSYSPHGKRLASHPRFTTIRYEDLVTDPDMVQNQLIARMPFLKTKLPFSRFHEVASPSEKSLRAMRGIRPVSPESVGAWRRHLPRIAGQLCEHGSISADLVEYGYERDDSWERSLDGVAPDRQPSLLAEHTPRPKATRGKYLKAPLVALGHREIPLRMIRQLQRWLHPVRSRLYAWRRNR